MNNNTRDIAQKDGADISVRPMSQRWHSVTGPPSKSKRRRILGHDSAKESVDSRLLAIAFAGMIRREQFLCKYLGQHMTAPSGDRRPVASRSWKVSQAIASWLVARNCSPNLISIVGMVAGLVGGATFVTTARITGIGPMLYLLVALCIQVRLLANLLDGMVAIQSGKASRLGELFNEVPDRVSDTALLVGAGFAWCSDRQLGLWAALAAMSTAYVRTTARTAGAPMDFCGPMAKQHRMVVLTLACLACVVVEVSSPGIHSGQIMMLALWVILIGSVITTGRRLTRAARFLQNSSLREDS